MASGWPKRLIDWLWVVGAAHCDGFNKFEMLATLIVTKPPFQPLHVCRWSENLMPKPVPLHCLQYSHHTLILLLSSKSYTIGKAISPFLSDQVTYIKEDKRSGCMRLYTSAGFNFLCMLLTAFFSLKVSLVRIFVIFSLRDICIC